MPVAVQKMFIYILYVLVTVNEDVLGLNCVIPKSGKILEKVLNLFLKTFDQNVSKYAFTGKCYAIGAKL